MSKLIIVSGPSGVGKNTLVDVVLANYPMIQYFKKETTRIRRPDDRNAEANFLTKDEYNERRSRHRIALPYKVRGEDYGLPVESFAQLKDDPRIVCLSNFDLIKSLSEAFDTTTVYVTAPIDVIIQRLKQRQDTPEQRRRSIESVAEHLQSYDRFRELFDYEITNGDDLQAAKNRIMGVIKEEIAPHRKIYSGFLLNEYEFDNIPNPQEIAERLKGIATLSMSVEVPQRGAYQFVGDSIGLKLYTHEDNERKGVFYGRLILEGPKKNVAKTAALLEELFPALSKYNCRQEVIQD